MVSFHATKLMTTGEGGMAFSSTEAGFERLREAKHGRLGNPIPGWSFPMSDLQAGLGLSQLGRYDSFIDRRSAIARRYMEALTDWPETIPSAFLGRSLFSRFPLRIAALDYDAVKDDYSRHGIQVRRGVDAVLHHRTGEPDGAFPHTMRAFTETLSIPLYPALTDGEVDHIANITKEVLHRYVH
jgi:perosamine synthetase